MKNRFKLIRQHKDINMSQEAFGKRLGVTGAAISRIESGSRDASEQIILAVCREFNVNETWLRTGEEEMFVPNPASELEALAKKYELSHDARVLVEEFVNLKPDLQQVFVEFARKAAENFRATPATPARTEPDIGGQERTEVDIAAELAELERQNREKDKQLQDLAAKVAAMKKEDARMEAAEDLPDNVIRIQFNIPGYSMPMSAGTGQEARQEYPEDYELIKKPPRGTSFIATVSGNSMEPTYHDGDLLFIHACEEVAEGQVGVFYMDGQQWVKELGDGVLISHNPAYPPRPMTDDVRCQGLVLGVCDSSYFE